MLFCRLTGIYSFPSDVIAPRLFFSFSDEATAGYNPQLQALMGHEQRLSTDKVHTEVTMAGQTLGNQTAVRDCIYQQCVMCNPFCELVESQVFGQR